MGTRSSKVECPDQAKLVGDGKVFSYQEKLEEYYNLSTLKELSEVEADKLGNIIESAQTDKVLSGFIDQVDDLTFQDWKFLNGNNFQEQSIEELIATIISEGACEETPRSPHSTSSNNAGLAWETLSDTVSSSEPVELFPQLFRATVTQTLSSTKPGRIRYRASFWPARFYGVGDRTTAPPGYSVIAIGRQGITILVVPTEYAFSKEWKQRILSRQMKEKGLKDKTFDKLNRLKGFEFSPPGALQV